MKEGAGGPGQRTLWISHSPFFMDEPKKQQLPHSCTFAAKGLVFQHPLKQPTTVSWE